MLNFRTLKNFALVCLFPSTFIASCNDADSSHEGLPDKKATELSSEQKRIIDSMIDDARAIVRPGDLVLRTGTDFSSDQVRGLNLQDKTYSHGGIALADSNGVFIYHVEPDYYYMTDKVRKESLDSFCSPIKNDGFAIARYQLSEGEINNLLNYLELQYQLKIPFDIEFKLETDDKMYCSEMIKKGLSKATTDRINIGTVRLTDRTKFKEIRRYFKLKDKDIMSRDIVPIDMLYLNPHCQLIKQYRFPPSL